MFAFEGYSKGCTFGSRCHPGSYQPKTIDESNQVGRKKWQTPG